MKTIIAGSRGIDEYSKVEMVINECPWEITEIVSGAARGVDSLGELWAKRNNISLKRFPANWLLYGKAAGFRRNTEMGNYADALIAIWDGESRGTKHMIDYMKKLNKPTYIEVLQ